MNYSMSLLSEFSEESASSEEELSDNDGGEHPIQDPSVWGASVRNQIFFPDEVQATAFADYSKTLGLDAGSDADLMWLVQEALTYPLPVGWTEHEDSEGRLYLHNEYTNESRWTHPADIIFKDLVGVIKGLRDETPSASEARRKTVMETHLKTVHDNFSKLVEDWSGPYVANGKQYYYNHKLDSSSWDNPVLDLENELAIRNKVLHRCLLQEWPGNVLAASLGHCSSREPQVSPMHVKQSAIASSLQPALTSSNVPTPRTPNSARSFHSACSARSSRSTRGMNTPIFGCAVAKVSPRQPGRSTSAQHRAPASRGSVDDGNLMERTCATVSATSNAAARERSAGVLLGESMLADHHAASEAEIEHMIASFALDHAQHTLVLPPTLYVEAHTEQRTRVHALLKGYEGLRCTCVGFGAERQLHILKTVVPEAQQTSCAHVSLADLTSQAMGSAELHKLSDRGLASAGPTATADITAQADCPEQVPEAQAREGTDHHWNLRGTARL